ncbi:phosphate ABC transporter permease subunit PstC [Sandaracinobacter sp. RS1-74]|uniref:phosphate ABC transporter permease subunit PstC n=1 Tax=Sandaracinobacteroides sayramensis TaxID=2913411 RepID=UPI001EDA97F0|nr:phosphate ABC transporter permease subunit PstC [Sandaracinobacteroides sayramensis]MCG2841025.1 phosphate ABC transporter permease subunit PstC [Sandaracinobacteroides sayramensis]
MSLWAVLLAVLALGALGFWLGRRRALGFVAQAGSEVGAVHSRPHQHGVFVAILSLLPALAVIAAWAALAGGLVSREVLASLPEGAVGPSDLERSAFLAEVRGLVRGDYAAAFNAHAEAAAAVWKASATRYAMLFGSAALALGALGALWGWSRLTADFRARTRVERFVMLALVLASLVAILTTFGIVASLLFESFRFFQLVSPVEFLFGTQWSPQTAMRADQVGSSGAFGAVPLFWGTVFIGAIIAMLVAIPLGLMTAIYLTQYAAPGVRKVAKPVLEVLAGVPTVVYGFFAALTVAPAVRDFALSIGISNASSESALAAGLVMGVMIIPFVSSMADDALTAVPRSMRDGSLAMGATPSETIRKVLIPAALPGIVGGVLLAVSRAIGETMIVVMAAGLAARLTANPFDSVTTVTAQIVALLTGDQEFDSAKTLSAFALGLVLFLVTLALNVYALAVVKKYREAYD